MIAFQGAEKKEDPSKIGVSFSSDDGITWSDLVVIASDPNLNFREADLLRLNDGRYLASIRTDDEPYDSYQSYSSDEGKSWTPVEKSGFKGHCPSLFHLNAGIACVYRDMEYNRPGISYSVTYDNGQTWQYGGQLYKSPSAYTGWASACGYPSLLRLRGGKIFCLFHTDAVDNNSEIRGVYLKDNS